MDFARARKVTVPPEAAERKKAKPGFEESRPPVRDDLEGLWAVAQVDQFNDLDNEVREFGFYSFAAAAAARKYGVRGPDTLSQRMLTRGGWRGGPGRVAALGARIASGDRLQPRNQQCRPAGLLQ